MGERHAAGGVGDRRRGQLGIRLRAALPIRRIAHSSVRFRDNEDGAAQVRAANGGLEICPTVHVNDQRLANPRWYDVLRAAAAGRRECSGSG